MHKWVKKRISILLFLLLDSRIISIFQFNDRHVPAINDLTVTNQWVVTKTTYRNNKKKKKKKKKKNNKKMKKKKPKKQKKQQQKTKKKKKKKKKK